MQVKKLRDSNLELYRIILMLSIIAHHYVVNSGLLDVLGEEPLSLKAISFYIFGMWGKTGINCFVLITGYFMCTSKITSLKFYKLVSEVMFYNIVIYAIFVLSGYTGLSLKGLLFALLPVTSVSDGFASCFIVFYLFIPFLNVLVQHMTKRYHLLLIGLCVFVYTVLGTIPKINVRMNYVEWFCVLYFISSYIRMYGLPKKVSVRIIRISFLASLIVSVVSVVGIRYFFPSKEAYMLVSDSNHIMALFVSIFTFLTFKTLCIRPSKLINYLAQSVFGVLLIHANSDLMRHWLWDDVVNVIYQYQNSYAILWAMLTVIVIFAVCTFIDQLRIAYIERPLVYVFRKFKE